MIFCKSTAAGFATVFEENQEDTNSTFIPKNI